MASNIIYFKTAITAFNTALNGPSENSISIGSHTTADAQHASYQIPAYKRRTQWSARQALELRGKQAIQLQTAAPALPLKVIQTRVQDTRQNGQQRLILSGRMADVCSMLNRMHDTGN